MMSDYGRTQELVGQAQNSAGASSKQYEKTLDSLETKLTQLDNAWDTFATGIMDEGLLKTGIDILTKFMDVVNNSTGKIGGLFGSIQKIGVVISIFNILKGVVTKFGKWLVDTFTKAGKEMGIGISDGVTGGVNNA
jgi:hypothetical protein